MPGGDVRRWEGYSVRVEPHSHIRRWLRWPFYFENRNPSFDVVLTKETDPATSQIQISALFSDCSSNRLDGPQPIPLLAIGEKATLHSRAVFTPMPGQTRIILPLGGAQYHTLYTYFVRREEQLWGAAYPVLTALLMGASAVIGGAVGRGWEPPLWPF